MVRTAASRPSRGQASVELLALAAAVAALAAALTLAGGGLPAFAAAAVARALGAGGGVEAPSPPRSLAEAPPDVRRFVLRAVQGADDGSAPSLVDAERRLAAAMGPQAARAELRRLAWAALLAREPAVAPGGIFRAVDPLPLGRFEGSRLNGIGPVPAEDRTMFWSTERLRGGEVAMHLVTADEERRLVEALQPGLAERVEAVAFAGGKILISALHPALAATFVAVDAAEAGLRREPGRGVPPGAREGDATFCLEVERTNHVGRDGARFGETVEALQPGRPIALTRIAVVRDGRLVAQGLANEEHCA
jgi:hypothetical protein